MAPKEPDYLEVAEQRALQKQTHVSFPQLKYASLRDEGLKDPMQWLVGKSMDDGAEGLWRIHEGLYDLNEFMHKHPGGLEWLELTKGTDITEAFVTHHINPVVEKVLTKFFVRDAKTPRNSPFTFKKDGFYRTLKRAVRQELEKIPKHIPKYTNMITDGLLITCFLTSALACRSTNYWVVMASYLIASVSLAWLTIADFRVSYALSHHLYTNTLMDVEISGFEPIIFWNPRKDKPRHAYYTLFIEYAMFPFMFLLTFIKRFMLDFIRKGFFSQHFKWHDGIGFLLPAWMYLAGGSAFYDAVIMWLWINCTGSFVCFIIGANAAHHHPKIFKDGDHVSDVTPDWGMHELEAVMDRKEINNSHFRVMTFFGHHALHHLFPTLDHAVLKYF